MEQLELPFDHSPIIGEVTKDSIQYTKGYNWVSKKPALYQTSILGYNAVTEYVVLNEKGQLYLKHGYAIDGISGVTGYIWEKLLSFGWLRNNCWPHDGIYQLVRLCLLPLTMKAVADEDLKKGSIRDGAWAWQAEIAYQFVKRFGTAVPNSESNVHPTFTAP
jgi:hypothetical protein